MEPETIKILTAEVLENIERSESWAKKYSEANDHLETYCESIMSGDNSRSDYNSQNFSISQNFSMAIITFLMMKHSRKPVKKLVSTVSKRIKWVYFNNLSGKVYVLCCRGEYRPAIYLGQTNLLDDDSLKKDIFPFFYVLGHSGMSYWDDIRKEDLENQIELSTITRLQRFHVVKFPVDIKCEQPKSQDIFEKMEQLSDCIIQCPDGMVKSSRFLLAQRSPYLMTYFTKYSNSQNVFPVSFKRSVVQEYLRCVVSGKFILENILDDITEVIEMCNYLQDFRFMKSFYKKVVKHLTIDQVNELNGIIQSTLNLKDAC
jgi:hypothetical protein